jgi:hypothetical protein
MDPPTRVHPAPLRFCLLLAAALVPGVGCAAAEHPPDAPVPASEPRAVLRLQVDLSRAQDCEEAFDLGLYRDRAVEVIAWEGPGGRCDGRTVTIRYLSGKASRDHVLRAAAALAAKVTALPEPNGDPR